MDCSADQIAVGKHNAIFRTVRLCDGQNPVQIIAHHRPANLRVIFAPVVRHHRAKMNIVQAHQQIVVRRFNRMRHIVERRQRSAVDLPDNDVVQLLLAGSLSDELVVRRPLVVEPLLLLLELQNLCVQLAQNLLVRHGFLMLLVQHLERAAASVHHAPRHVRAVFLTIDVLRQLRIVNVGKRLVNQLPVYEPTVVVYVALVRSTIQQWRFTPLRC